MAKIDVHAHCVPPSYREYCLENDFAQKGHPDGMPAIPVCVKNTLLKILSHSLRHIALESVGPHGLDATPQYPEVGPEHVIVRYTLDARQ